MSDNISNLTIFRLSKDPTLDEIAASFKGFPELAAPIALAQAAGLTLYAIPAHKDKGVTILPVFTASGLIPTPHTVKPALPFLLTLFQAPSADIFAFNPAGNAPGEPTGEVRLDKRRLSAVIGSLQMSSPLPSGPELETAWKNEAGIGSLHRANYMASVFFAGNQSAPRSASYAEILINLGLLKEACNYIGDLQTPGFSCCMASILRLSRNPAHARQWLEKVPAGTDFEDKKRLELAWLELEEGRFGEALTMFRSLAQNSSEKPEALFGVGAALMRKAFQDRNPGGTAEALSAFSSAISCPSPFTPEIFIHMGEAHAGAGEHAEAEACYRKAAESRPTVRATVALGLALIKNNKLTEAAALITGLALIDPDSAGRLADGLPRDSAAQLLASSLQPPKIAAAAPPQGEQAAHPRPAPGPEFRPPPPPPQLRRPVLEMESLMEAAGASIPTEAETRKDDFMSRAFTLAAAMEEETGKTIHFNADGLSEAEKRLRLIFVNTQYDRQKALETIKDCSAFLCFLLQERFRGRVVKIPDFDHWGWPVVFELPKHITTYPIQRIWKLLWQEGLPEPGWLTKYLRYVEDELKSGQAGRPQGSAAVRARVPSHPERLVDAQTEHKRILLLTETLQETSGIEIGRPGVAKLEKAIKWNFKPDSPPTTDGWKLLRCYGHIMAEIFIRDFNAVWYNTDGNDGLWSLETPGKTFLFPIGKIYKAASRGEGLVEYYDLLLKEKLRSAGGSKV